MTDRTLPEILRGLRSAAYSHQEFGTNVSETYVLWLYMNSQIRDPNINIDPKLEDNMKAREGMYRLSGRLKMEGGDHNEYTEVMTIQAGQDADAGSKILMGYAKRGPAGALMDLMKTRRGARYHIEFQNGETEYHCRFSGHIIGCTVTDGLFTTSKDIVDVRIHIEAELVGESYDLGRCINKAIRAKGGR